MHLEPDHIEILQELQDHPGRDHAMTPTLERLVDAEYVELGRTKSPLAVMPIVTPNGRKALDAYKAERS